MPSTVPIRAILLIIHLVLSAIRLRIFVTFHHRKLPEGDRGGTGENNLKLKFICIVKHTAQFNRLDLCRSNKKLSK